MSATYVEGQPASATVIKVPLAQVHQNFPIPSSCQPYINYIVWTEIIQARRTSALSANCSACVIEWMLCLFVIAFIPFLFHPCLALCFNEMAIRGSMNNLNNRHYEGRRVLSMDPWFLYVNPAELPASFVLEQGGVHPPVVVIQPAVYGNYPGHAQSQAPVFATAEYGAYAKAEASTGSGSGYAPVAQRVEVVSDRCDGRSAGVTEAPGNTMVSPFGAVRRMRITIPAGAVAGQTITAVSPDGVTVSLSIPNGVAAGETVLVNY